MLTFFEAVFLSNCPLICSHSKSHPSPMTGGLPPPRCSPTEASILPAMLPASQNPTPTYLIAPLLFQQHNTVPRNPIHHQWQHKIKKNCQRHNGHQGIIEYFDSFNSFSSKQKLQQALKSWPKLSLALFSKGGEIQRGTLTNPCNNWEKFMYQFWQIHLKT